MRSKAAVSADAEEDVLEPLIDTTQALSLRSKRTERAQKKKQKAQRPKFQGSGIGFADLPYEMFLTILSLLPPSDVFILSRVSKPLRHFVIEQDATIAAEIRKWRYPCLEKCLRVPVLLEDVDPEIHPMLQTEDREQIRQIRHKPFSHILSPDPDLICTCMTCILAWNSLCIAVDFANWQENLDEGLPVPIVPRGKNPEWNRILNANNADIVCKALRSPLWHARILEEHLHSTVRSIDRHRANKGNRRNRFRMDQDDYVSGTDLFLERSGPPTIDIPFHRDSYYMLEAFLPNRSWNKQEQRWMYVPASQHDTDVQMVAKWAPWLAQKAKEERGEKELRRRVRLQLARIRDVENAAACPSSGQLT